MTVSFTLAITCRNVASEFADLQRRGKHAAMMTLTSMHMVQTTYNWYLTGFECVHLLQPLKVFS